ncbi:uncharacterized protein stbd1 [Salarias fasciatus]|uniref:uncharacterized protein stbd1 n=1 Tax=Salarias fasciatus TaxID=181472 RepID=UPI001176E638|nr:uncharacterized protein LOC115382777 [Salarias fasciatus]
MPVKNSVAVERRTDLASLFCMIGRHGPAVALAVIAMVSVVAGFIFYRNVRGKRRKATVGEAAAVGAGAGAGAERDASVIGTDEELEPELEQEPSASTDVSEGSPYTKVDPDLIPSGPRLRHRRSPSAEKPPTFCPPQETSAVQDCYRVAETHEEEDIQSLQDDLTLVTAVDVKDVEDGPHSATDDSSTDAEPDCNVENYLHPELVHETHTEAKVLQAECEEDRNTIVDEVSQGDSEEEENLQYTPDSPPCPEQDFHLSETTDDFKLQDGLDTGSNLEKPIVETEEDISLQTNQVEEILSCVSNSSVCFEQDLHMSETKDDELQGSEATPDTNSELDEPINNTEDFQNGEEVENLCASNSPICFTQVSQIRESVKLHDSEITPNTICSVEQPITQIKEVFNGKISQEEESSQCVSTSPVCLDQDVHVGDNGEDHKLQVSEVPSVPDGNLEQMVTESEAEPTPHICEKIEVNLEENSQVECTEFSQNDPFQEEHEESKVEEAMLECSDDKVFAQQLGCLTSKQDTNLLCSQQDWCHATNVVLSSREDDHFQTAEVTEEIRGEDHLHNLTEVEPDVSPPEIFEHQLQDEHKEDNFAFSQEERVGEEKVVDSCNDKCEEVDNSVSCLNQSADSAKENKSSDTEVSASDIVHLPNLSSDDQQPQNEGKKDEITPVLMGGMEQDVMDKMCLQEEIASEKNRSDQVVALVEESAEHLGASCDQDQQKDSTESHEMLNKTENPSADSAACLTSSLSNPDLLASSQSVESDQMQTISAFPEVTSGATSDAAGCSENQISLSFVESQLSRSLSGFGGESGISSMAVSPDLSDALDEFGTTLEDVLPSEVDCLACSEEQAESPVIFTDDAAVSFGGDIAGGAPEPCENLPQQTGQDWAMDSSIAVNEDVFGNDVEDGYYHTVDQLMTEMAANVMTTDEIREASNEVPVLVVKTDGKEGAERKEEGRGA